MVWTLLFHYESLRYCYLEPLFRQYLPKVPFLFPRYGWLMYYKLANAWYSIQVYGVRKDKGPEPIDSHRILTTKPVGYDPIRRNLLTEVVPPKSVPDFCRYLERKFPEYDNFLLMFEGYEPLAPEKSAKFFFPASSTC